MRLADFILANVEPVLVEWDKFARSLAPGKKMTALALRNDSELILRATARDMKTTQSLAKQQSKSQGQQLSESEESQRLDHASDMHGVGRVGSGFDIVEVVSEYRALRATVLRLWRESQPQPDLNDVDDITRFNESLDQSLAKAVKSYTNRVDQSRRMFLAILSHDLRNPLSCIRMAAQIVSCTAPQVPESAEAVTIIEANTDAITRLTTDLIDFASTGLGSAMPLTYGPVDLKILCREVIESLRMAHPTRKLCFHAQGELTGEWDAARLRQVVSNLLGNALQHGAADGQIELTLVHEGSSVVLSVHNQGEPIPPEKLTTIFNPLVRHATLESSLHRVPGSIGLGLYIVREIVVAHAGTVEIASTKQDGTTFTVRIPRQQPV